MTTFAAVLQRRLQADPGRPLVTFYDHQSGERTELSLTTYANWVAKAAGLLTEEADLERGMRLRIDLPPHWLGTVFVGAAWTLGVAITSAQDADAVVCGPESLSVWVERRGPAVLACSLLPLGVRFADGVPAGVVDVGAAIWSHPDAFAPWDPPTGDDAAFDTAMYAGATQASVLMTAATGSLVTDGGRLLSVADPAAPPTAAALTEPLVRRGSLVVVRHPDPALIDALCADEQITHRGPELAMGAHPPRS